jgi:phage baseplate assembly protein W
MNDGIERINQSLSILFDTEKGSRMMQPEYGSDIQKYRFDPFDEILIDKLDVAIKESIRLWEPRIILDHIDYKTSSQDIDSHILYIQLRYHIINTDVEGNFVYPYRLGTQDTYIGKGVYGKYE